MTADRRGQRTSSTSFKEQVFAAVRKIPRGRVSTYKEIARAAGRPRACRAAGNALNKNPHAPRVPCHRVVKSDGGLGGYAGGLSKKVKLLAKEGAKIVRGKIDLKRFGYSLQRH
ncbi:MAG: MGMT family protein [Patescibacteria group bacterium]